MAQHNAATRQRPPLIAVAGAIALGEQQPDKLP